MATNSESDKLTLRAWFLTHRTRDVLRTCEDRIFGEYGLTAEQFALLSIMKALADPIRVTDLAHWLERSPNSVSMLVDRMVKAGLLARKRDKGDRRAVHVTMTGKGENALRPAMSAGFDFIDKILSPLSGKDRRAFVDMHEKVKYEALRYLNPGLSMEKMKRNEITNQPDLSKRLARYVSGRTPQDRHRGDEKKRTKAKTNTRTRT